MKIYTSAEAKDILTSIKKYNGNHIEGSGVLATNGELVITYGSKVVHTGLYAWADGSARDCPEVKN